MLNSCEVVELILRNIGIMVWILVFWLWIEENYWVKI